ncbi:ABC transporter ATP-binding protein [Desulfuromonas sp. TF]|uniref:ABC transporter ATP-binding protein n=1 Tax=Desulfuromonas sp. TF TaxID=1232410 RepID=UPI00040E1162|nr:ABC transporter ATP-binding protein [Desulfuromonas sp. TF]
MNDIAIKVENLTKVYKLYDKPVDRLKESVLPFGKKYHKDFYALRDVSLEVKKGESIGIIGKNGSGKSTLLKILSSVITPTSGNVSVHGNVSALLELGAGFNRQLTGIENIYFNGTLLGFSREQMDEKLDDILSFADIGDYVHQPMKSYSSGMFVRLAFAVKTSLEPDILIVDEALAVGDINFRQKCYDRLSEMRERGLTWVLVAHDIQAIKSNCDRCFYLKSGRVEMVGSPETVTERYLKDSMEERQKAIGGKNVSLEWKEEGSEGARFGSGKANIVSAAFVGRDGSADNVFNYGDRVKIEVNAIADQTVLNPYIVLQLRDLRGYVIYGARAMGPLSKKDSRERSTRRIKASFSLELPLAQGMYSLSLALNDYITEEKTIIHDKIAGALSFTMMDGNKDLEAMDRFHGAVDLKAERDLKIEIVDP